MKVGDLVTLSAYAKNSSDLSAWNDRLYPEKPKLVGLVVRIEENPRIHSWTSKNERTYYFINWINKHCPGSRYGKSWPHWPGGPGPGGYFLRNDLKFVRKG
jgi:hypothetical protein